MLKLATVHGRFQPPHLDHLEYMVAALQESEHLIIGITQPDSQKLADCPEDPHRAEVTSNPLSYDERCDAIRNMLIAVGVAPRRFSFVRFPIETPELLPSSVAQETVCFTTIRDEWNVVKVERLRSLGYDVRVLWDRRGQSGIQGTEIRTKIRNGDDSWCRDVHPAVASFLIESNILSRMR